MQTAGRVPILTPNVAFIFGAPVAMTLEAPKMNATFEDKFGVQS